MSPLARTLLALACATLLHASCADMEERVRAEIPDFDSHANHCGTLKMGVLNDKHAKKVILKSIYVPPKQLLQLSNVAKSNEALIGQYLFACDPTGLAKKVTLTPVSNRKHSPIKVHCEPRGACPKGVVAFTDQYVIKTIL